MRSDSMTYAPLKKRIYAFLLDYLVIVTYGIFVVGALSFLFRSFFLPLFSNSPVTAEWTGFLIITLPISLYFILCECSRWQGTWGKKKMSIYVVNSVGQRIGFFRLTIRTAIKFLPWEIAHFGIWQLTLPTDIPETTTLLILSTSNLVAFIYLLSPLTNRKRKTIYDWIVRTQVIYRPSTDQFILKKESEVNVKTLFN